MTFDPGLLSARLTLERPVETGDGQGGVTRTYETVTTLWARIEPVSAASREEAGAERAIVTHRIRLRRRDDISGGMRFRKGARVFVIRAARDPDETGRFTLCDCTEERP